VKRFEVVTLFPRMFRGPLEESILGRAQARGLIRVAVHDLRDFTRDRHRVVDDTPYGGGAGMVLKPEPLVAAVEALNAAGSALVILLTPQGELFTQGLAARLAGHDHLILVCGRYEGFDERVAITLGARQVSVGDYVLTGGELPALVVIDAVARLVPEVLGDADSARQDSFATGLLDHPQYTRPPVFRGLAVPEALLSGDHGRIRRWRRKEALRRTRARRPDLLARAALTDEDRALLDEIAREAIPRDED
jgi:tRNA (guanine37-N1)-methyltransferase